MKSLFGSKDPAEKEQREKEKEFKQRRKRAQTAGADVEAGFKPPDMTDIIEVKRSLSPSARTPPPIPTTQPLNDASSSQQTDFRNVLKRNKSLKEVEDSRKAKIEENSRTNVIDWKVKAKLQSVDKITNAWESLVAKKDSMYTELNEKCVTTKDLLNGLITAEALAHPALKDKGSELLKIINDIKTDMAAQMKHLESKIQFFNEQVNDCMERYNLEKQKEAQQAEAEAEVQAQAIQAKAKAQAEAQKFTQESASKHTVPLKQAPEMNNKTSNKSSNTASNKHVGREHVEEKKQMDNNTGRSYALSEPPPPPAFAVLPDAGKLWIALFDYTGGYRQDQELIFKKDTIVVSTGEQEGWLFGHIRGDPAMQGWFPANYVKSYQ